MRYGPDRLIFNTSAALRGMVLVLATRPEYTTANDWKRYLPEPESHKVPSLPIFSCRWRAFHLQYH